MNAAQIARRFTYFRTLQKNLRLYEAIYGDVCGLSPLRRHVIEEMRKLAKLMRYGAATLAALVIVVTGALAQHNHDQHHAFYQNWTNKNGIGCCNDFDCGELADQDERTTAAGGIEVRVEGVWCPVQAFHYLKSGNAPNWSTAHVCVRKVVVPGAVKVCERLLCYQPKPGT